MIRRLALEVISADPTRAEYRHGDTLGGAHAHCCRAKLFQQYCLFFRYRGSSRVIVHASVNDVLERRHPPDDWATLVAEARALPTSRDE